MANTKRRIAVIVGIVATLILGMIAVGCNGEPGDEPGERRAYYCDVNSERYTLEIGDGTFTMEVGGSERSGEYAESGKVVTLTYADGGTSNGVKDDGVITIDYDGIELRFYEKLEYTVTYESNGGSAVASEKVLNGKTIKAPSEPVRDGYVFVGWYTDDTYKRPYMFETQIVRGDITLYAQWGQSAVGRREYTVSFDLNYAGAEKLASKQTVGGKLYGATYPERDGYEFKGWWISMTGNADELGYVIDETTEFEESTTAYALWQSVETNGRLQKPWST